MARWPNLVMSGVERPSDTSAITTAMGTNPIPACSEPDFSTCCR